MNKLKTIWAEFQRRWKAETPFISKLIVRVCTGTLVAIPILSTGITGISTPQWFLNYAWYVFAVCSVLLIIFQTTEKKLDSE